MTDKQLLEYAAKAAGIPGKWDGEHNCFYEFSHAFQNPWNPLQDDGASLRLAVAIKAKITIGNAIIMVEVEAQGTPDIGQEFTDNPTAATRRAIIRTAAEIGKAMP